MTKPEILGYIKKSSEPQRANVCINYLNSKQSKEKTRVTHSNLCYTDIHKHTPLVVEKKGMDIMECEWDTS